MTALSRPMRWSLASAARHRAPRLALVAAALASVVRADGGAGGASASASCERHGGRHLDDPFVSLQQQLEVGKSQQASPFRGAAGKALQPAPGAAHQPAPGEAPQSVEDILKQLHGKTSSKEMGNFVEFCAKVQRDIQKMYQKRCGISREVICVWGDTDYCPMGSWSNVNNQSASEHCTALETITWSPMLVRPSLITGRKRCGYILENPFVRFDSYSCSIRALIPPDGKLQCNMSLTSIGILSLVGFWSGASVLTLVFLYLICGHVSGCLCPRKRSQQQPQALPQQQQPEAETSPSQRTNLLLSAAQRGDAAAVDYALRGGTSVDTRSRTNATPLISAAQFGHRDIVERLLRAGANVNASTDAGNTAVLLAALRGHIEVASLLVRWGADPRKPNNQGWCAVDVPGFNTAVQREVSRGFGGTLAGRTEVSGQSVPKLGR